jgi:hypothetical protein
MTCARSEAAPMGGEKERTGSVSIFFLKKSGIAFLASVG